MKKKIIKNFVYGTQYYRAPTPLPQEWERDLKAMGKAGLDTIQLRIQWRWNEPKEGKYLFDDIDRLFALSEKYRKEVILKFLMECAPDYVFFKYNGYRKDMHGLPMNPGAHGAFYVGGWLPCFDNPDVVRKAEEFVRVFVKRYKDRNNLMLWNIWNEPRSRPIGECGCRCSVEAYRQWLKDEYKNINHLNKEFGKSWEDFNTIMPPAMPHDYVELFLWRKWALFSVTKRLEFMNRAVRQIDDAKPVITHVGCCSIIQDVAGDGSDDLQNAGTVNFYGTSFPVAVHFSNIIEESRPFMICDWIRSISEYYWVYELYPDWGDWGGSVSLEDFRFKVWSTLACGNRGILYWQYRAERLGNENNLAGLVNIDGSFKKITYEAKTIGQIISKYKKIFTRARVKDDGIGILYSLESDLINRIENTGNETYWSFDLNGNGGPYLYKKALAGAYSLFRELGYTTRWIDVRKLNEGLNSIKLLYIPECFMFSEDSIKLIEDFSRKGGCIIAEEGIGLRGANTWLNPQWPAKKLGDIFGLKISERIHAELKNDYLTIFGHKIRGTGYISQLEIKNAEAIGSWSNGCPGAVQKGRLFYLGTSLGASFYENHEKDYHACKETLRNILKRCGITPGRNCEVRGLYFRELTLDDEKIVFVFNRTRLRQKVKLNLKSKEDVKLLTETLSVKKKDGVVQLTVLPYDVGIYLHKKAGR